MQFIEIEPLIEAVKSSVHSSSFEEEVYWLYTNVYGTLGADTNDIFYCVGDDMHKYSAFLHRWNKNLKVAGSDVKHSSTNIHNILVCVYVRYVVGSSFAATSFKEFLSCIEEFKDMPDAEMCQMLAQEFDIDGFGAVTGVVGKITKLATDKNARFTFSIFNAYAQAILDLNNTKVSVMSELQGANHLKQEKVKDSIMEHCSKYFEPFPFPAMKVDLPKVIGTFKKYSGGYIDDVLTIASNNLVSMGLVGSTHINSETVDETDTKALEKVYDDMHKCLEGVFCLVEAIISSMYAALGTYVVSGGTPALNKRNAKHFYNKMTSGTGGVIKSMHDNAQYLLYISENNLKYCDKVVKGNYKDCFSVLKIQSKSAVSKAEGELNREYAEQFLSFVPNTLKEVFRG